MKISIQQTIHGYRHGHELLGSSIDLELESRNTLLFQSDLSGSMVGSGFNEYLTGYPLQGSNVYVFAKTWYATEMRRPGCVWTHSLLIEFADLGKIPELKMLKSLFVRPNEDDFDRYTHTFVLDISDALYANPERSLYSQKKLLLIDALYTNPSKVIVVPALSSVDWEDETLEIWSDQWPRLRRNFKFCTGALNFKVVDGGSYDLQIVPTQNLLSFERKADNSFTLDIQKTVFEHWTETLIHSRKSNLRRFLWRLGANVDGDRRNFIFLVTLFSLTQGRKVNPAEILSYIQSQFPGLEKGKFLKKTLFGLENILQLDEVELLDYILTNGDGLLDFDDLQVRDRIIHLINERQLDYFQLSRWLKSTNGGKVLTSVWEDISLRDETIVELIKFDPDVVKQFALRLPDMVGNLNLWRLPPNTVTLILNELYNLSFPIDWIKIIHSFLEIKSDAIFELREKLGESVTFLALDWVKGDDSRKFSYKWEQFLIKRDNAFRTWLRAPRNQANSYIFSLVFQLSPQEFGSMPFNAKDIIAAYEKQELNDSVLRKRLPMTLLAVGFSNSIAFSYLLVEKFFPELYKGLCVSRFGGEIWDIVVKEKPFTDSEPISFLTFFSFWDKKKDSDFIVESWDHARFLIVKTVNAFIKYSWPLQSFAIIFKEKKELNDAVHYCMTFQEGNLFLKYLLSEIHNKKVNLANSQKQFFQ